MYIWEASRQEPKKRAPKKLSIPLAPALPANGETKIPPATGNTFSFWDDESLGPTPGNEESKTRGRIRQESPKSAFDLLDESVTLPPAEREATSIPPISECK